MNFIKGLGLKKLDGEILQHILGNLMVNCREFLQHNVSNYDGEFHHGLRSEKIGW